MSFKVLIWGDKHDFNRIITPETLAFHRRWELFRPRRYKDGAVWAIGYGHAENGDNEPKVITKDMEITIEQAEELLLKDIAIKARYINTRVKVPLTTYMYGALVSMTYQYGQGRIDKSGLVIPKLNSEDYVDAACEMLQLHTNKDGTVNKGLMIRRACEVAFYMTKIN